MKKYIFTIIFFIILLTSTSLAMTAESFDVNVQINSDGSADVIETTVFDISDHINGFLFDINYKNGLDKIHEASGISNLVIKVDGEKYSQIEKIDYFDMDNKYILKNDNTKINMQIFIPSQNIKRTVTLSYKINDVIAKHRDFSDFSWNFISPDVEYETRNVNITIKIPNAVNNINNLKVWGHGPLSGESEIIDNQTVLFKIDSASSSWVGARVAFPSSLINDDYSKNYDNITINDIIREEKALADKANKQRFFDNFVKPLFISLIVIITLAIIFYPFYNSIKIGKELKPFFNNDYYRDIPATYSPAVMSYLMTLKPIRIQNISATILDLSRRGFIKIEDIVGGDIKLSINNSNFESLAEHEKFFINTLILPYKKEITLKQIEDENDTPGRASIFMKNYNKWTDLVIKDTDSLGLIDLEVRIKQKVYNKIGTSMFSLFYMLAYIFIEMNLIILSGISIILATYGLILKSLSQNQKRTRKGIEDYAKWKAFKKFYYTFLILNRMMNPR
jgi:hypothetical protein